MAVGMDMYIHMCVDMCIHMCVDMCIDMCMDMCMHMYIHTYVDLCTVAGRAQRPDAERAWPKSKRPASRHLVVFAGRASKR